VRRWLVRTESLDKAQDPARRQAAGRAYVARQRAELHS
jgi:hypothetical protein